MSRSIVNECSDGTITYNPVDSWEYQKDFGENQANSTKINVSGITYDYWDTTGDMFVNSNETFTMPEHYVIFYYTGSPSVT